jgi:hypothetical protein
VDELESALLVALPRLRPILISVGMPAELDDGEAVAWLRTRLDARWARELEPTASGSA